MEQISQRDHRSGISGQYGALELVKTLNITVLEDGNRSTLHSKKYCVRANIFQCAFEVFHLPLRLFPDVWNR